MRPNPWYRLSTFKAALWVARVFPRRLTQVCAGAIGRASYRLNKRARAILRENIEPVAGPSGRDLDAICAVNFSNFIRMLADYFYATSASPEQIMALLGEWRGFENLTAARERGKGAILVTAHLGNWELGALILAAEGLPITVVTLEEPSTELTRWREKYRERLGIRTIAVGSNKFAFVEMINTLRRNEYLAMLVDRPYANSGCPVQFMGRETQFSNAPALLWKHTDAAILPAFVIQKPDGKYLSFVDPPIPMESSAAGGGDAIAANTRRLASEFEKIIRNHPEQWYHYVPVWADRMAQETPAATNPAGMKEQKCHPIES